ncbi:MAG: hypothetical protein H7Z14_21740 [Anaerolineae bacterium]|nr:hypothetical protein [Phycisphaerae bacterium]
MNRSLRHPAGPAITSAVAALIVYAVTLGGTFVYDDFDVFAADARLRVPSTWSRYWTESYNGGVDNLYRPLVSMTYAIQWLIHGDEAKWPYHAVNWILHAAVAALVAELTRRLIDLAPRPVIGEGLGEGPTKNAEPSLSRRPLILALSPSTGRGDQSAAYVAGLLFAVHPIHVEAVANVVGRAELLCALGFLGALVIFAHRPLTTARVFAIFGCLALSILSKEQGMLLPPMLLAMALLTRQESNRAEHGDQVHTPGATLSYATRSTRRISRPALLLTILVCWSVAGYIVFRESILKFSWDRGFLDWTINPLVRSVGVDRWFMPFVILGHYVALLIAPIYLSPDYGSKVIGWTVRWNDPYLWIGIVSAFASVFAILTAWKRQQRAVLFCLIGLLLTYGLISNFAILIGTNFGERLMYLPSAFFLILVAIIASRSRSLRIALTIVIVLFSVRTITYAGRWNDRRSFYEYSIAHQPDSIRLRMLLIAELQREKKLDEADRVAADARALLPEYDEIWIQSADLASARGEFDRAEEYLNRAMTIRPSNKAAGRLQQLYEERAKAATQPTSRR